MLFTIYLSCLVYGVFTLCNEDDSNTPIKYILNNLRFFVALFGCIGLLNYLFFFI